MLWEETYIDANFYVQYNLCKKCNDYPALAIEYDLGREGPFCELCWHVHITEQFDALRKKLDDENWGDMPPCDESCIACKAEKKLYDMQHNQLVDKINQMEVNGLFDEEKCIPW